MGKNLVRLTFVLLILVGIAACTTTSPPGSAANPVSRHLAKAESLFRQGQYTRAMIECVDLAQKDPQMAGLPELQNKIMTALTKAKTEAAQLRAKDSYDRLALDIYSGRDIPDTYGLRRPVVGLADAVQGGLPTAMQEVLKKKVTVNLDGVNLDDFILAIGASEDVNIIADSMDTDATMTVRAQDVPLAELLDYIARNMGIAFYVGENVIWATERDQGLPETPMETRIYRLRKGISGDEMLLDDGRINIVEAVERFVPLLEGADLLYDKKAHVLIARNTRENLVKVEEIVRSLDVCPPQILIEARFIGTSISDLRELGIDWILNSPVVVTRKNVIQNGEVVSAPRTVVKDGTTLDFTPFPGQMQGLNFAYEGLLTDPMFEAVLHALETSGKARVLSIPKVTTVNNRPARIRIGEDFRFFEEYDVQSVPSAVSDGGSQIYSSVLVPVGTPTLEELGIELNVTPSVGADMRSITLSLIPEISEFVRYEQFETAGSNAQRVNTGNNNTGNNAQTTNTTGLIKLPIFRRSTIETEVVVSSGETVVMGGLVRALENKTDESVPILSHIPIIGHLFRHKGIEETQENLLIFVTATILSQRGEDLVPIVEVVGEPRIEKEFRP